MVAKLYLEIEELGDGTLHFNYHVNGDDATDQELRVGYTAYNIMQLIGNIDKNFGEYDVSIKKLIKHFMKQGNNPFVFPREN